MAVDHPFADRHEQAPDEDVLFAARHLDVLGIAFAERDRPVAVVDVEIKIGIAPQVGLDIFFQRQLLDARKEPRCGIDTQHPLAVVVQVVVPMEQVFGKGVEIQRIGIATVLALACFLEIH